MYGFMCGFDNQILPTQSILRVISRTRALLEFWISLKLQIGTPFVAPSTSLFDCNNSFTASDECGKGRATILRIGLFSSRIQLSYTVALATPHFLSPSFLLNFALPFSPCSIEHVVGSKVTVADACAIVIYRNITLYRMSGFLLNMIIAQVNYRDNIEILVYRATLAINEPHLVCALWYAYSILHVRVLIMCNSRSLL